MSTDWQALRKNMYSSDHPPEWPEGVRAISIDGTMFIGVHAETGEMYWDGRKVVTQKPITLGLVERFLVGLAAVGTFGVFVIELGRSLALWK
ncbi:hypothetical protein [Caballeronia sp. NCTM5]|uniref:hypothetical protein n=1 Tax=Caballeronia sp. NCTM5 TaxID=2921755 RepID=UPI002027A3D2|nr:hypothetical protein [Caballeronia sp. NCTM5]